jgi:hypothetical protein
MGSFGSPFFYLDRDNFRQADNFCVPSDKNCHAERIGRTKIGAGTLFWYLLDNDSMWKRPGTAVAYSKGQKQAVPEQAATPFNAVPNTGETP